MEDSRAIFYPLSSILSGWLAVPIEPLQRALHMVGAMARLAAAGQLVPLARVAHELDHLLAPAQNREELLGLADRHAVVLLAVQNPQRRSDLVRVRQRRVLPELLL